MTDPASPPTVLVIDDHELVSTSLVLVLRERGMDAHAVPIRSASEILHGASDFSVGLALLDLDLGLSFEKETINGLELVLPLSEDGWRILVVTASSEPSRIAAAIAAGCVGWVPKTAPLPDLLRTIEAAVAGQPVMSPTERRHWLEIDRRARAERRGKLELLERLTPRELEILELLAQGQRVGSIAARSVVSPATVRTQVRSILAKLEVSSQLEAVAIHRAASR
jgi:DNA-binding NarL/FixJ family response regulator